MCKLNIVNSVMLSLTKRQQTAPLKDYSSSSWVQVFNLPEQIQVFSYQCFQCQGIAFILQLEPPTFTSNAYLGLKWILLQTKSITFELLCFGFSFVYFICFILLLLQLEGLLACSYWLGWSIVSHLFPTEKKDKNCSVYFHDSISVQNAFGLKLLVPENFHFSRNMYN